jgi:hypothetical protein
VRFLKIHAVIGALVGVLAVSHVQGQDRRHSSGQTVTPSFDGWFPNADGTFSLVFGYFNRNFQQEVDVPIGAGNAIEPGGPDQGQPTHFLPRRQFGAFTVKVPKDFGTRTLTWTLVTQGQKLSVPGYLRPEWQISAFRENTTGDQPPLVKWEAAGKPFDGPGGGALSLQGVVGQPMTLSMWATPRPGDLVPHEGPPQSVPVTWSLFRGAPAATFSDVRPKAGKDGRVATTVSFREPGSYTLRVLAGIADTTGCCWTNGFVRVDVRGAGK